jgi:hypothetical protein
MVREGDGWSLYKEHKAHELEATHLIITTRDGE